MADPNPNDPVLTSPHAAYEPSAIMRLHLAGHRSQAILEEFRLRGTQLIKQIEQSKHEISEATAKGRPIHDALIPKEKT